MLWTLILRLYLRSLRLQGPSLPTQDLILGIWHQDLISSMVLCRGQKLLTLVSQSKDGSWLAQLLKSMGFDVLRGSSSRAYQNLRHFLGQNHPIWAMALDGPKGPPRIAKAGTMWLAQQSKRPIYRLECQYQCAWSLQSWDQFRLPLPGSRISYQLIQESKDVPH